MAEIDIQWPVASTITLAPMMERALPLLDCLGHKRAMFVGGCVRDCFMGVSVNDIDIATSCTPPQVKELAEKAGFICIATGLQHGTWTILVDGLSCEVTALRRDTLTDGRHAKVDFSASWQDDAQRRDFTFNALYCSMAGDLFDPCDGLDDIKRGRVRFINDPTMRIEEDYLRILRYFRFHGRFGAGFVDVKSLAACRRLAKFLPYLSAERIWSELNMILTGPRSAMVVAMMYGQGILQKILPAPIFAQRLARLIALEKRLTKPCAARRLAVILNADVDVDALAKRLRLSRQETKVIHDCRLQLDTDSKDRGRALHLWSIVLYRHGRETAQHNFLAQATARQSSDDQPILWRHIATWPVPVLPIRGRDLQVLGMTPSKELGDLLERVEAWWIAQDFQPNRQACLDQAGRWLDQ